MRSLVIIPAFNEADTIEGVINELRTHFDGDFAVIDDASHDNTAGIARQAGAFVLQHPCNLGIGATVQTGFLYAQSAGYDFVIRQDGDGQHDPSYITLIIEALAADQADIVIGSRFLAREGYQSTLVRRVGIMVLGVVSVLVGSRVTDPTSGYWGVNRRAIEVLAQLHPDDYPETEALLLASRAECRIRELPVMMRARSAGRSSIGAAYAGFYMLKVILALLVERLRWRH